MKKKHLIPIVIELIGISVVGAGIGLELAFGGEIYLVMITTGSLFIATGGVIWGKFIKREEGK